VATLGVDGAEPEKKLRVWAGRGTPPGQTVQWKTEKSPHTDGFMADTDTLLVYEKPTCTTCRKMIRLLKERGVEFERLDYFIDPIPKQKLKELLAKMRLGPRDLLRTREKAYKELGLKDPGISDPEILDALVKHPELIQRPIIEKGDRAVLGRPVERVLELL